MDTSTIPKPAGKEEIFYKNGDTDNIIRVILLTDKEHDKRFDAFAKEFAGDDGLYKLWKFVRNEIAYKEDPTGVQKIKTPAALWRWGEGDCKSKTLFITNILKCLKIKYLIRFTSYDNSQQVTHVYPIAIVAGKKIILDSVYHKYDAEKPYTYKVDYSMTQISRISGTATPLANELAQRQAYVPADEPINFGGSDGDVKLQIAKRQLQLIGVMQDSKAAFAKKGIELIDKQLNKGINAITGVIPTELNTVASLIESIRKEPASYRNALSFGLNTNTTAIGTVANLTRAEFIKGNYFLYGSNSDYKKRYTNADETWIKNLASSLRSSGKVLGIGINPILQNIDLISFASETDKKDFVKQIQAHTGIMGEYLNNVFQTTQKGTAGTGVLYGFCTDTTESGKRMSLNDFPVAVASKAAFHNNWLGGVSLYSGLSIANVKGLARNGVLFDTGQQPETQLAAYRKMHTPAVGDFGITAAIALATVIAGVIAAIAAALKESDEAAAMIDESQKDASNLKVLTEQNLFSESDWTITQDKTTNSNTSKDKDNSNSGLLIGALALGGYFWYNK